MDSRWCGILQIRRESDNVSCVVGKIEKHDFDIKIFPSKKIRVSLIGSMSEKRESLKEFWQENYAGTFIQKAPV